MVDRRGGGDEQPPSVDVRPEFTAPDRPADDDLALGVAVLPQPLLGAVGLLGAERGGDQGRDDRRMRSQGCLDLMVQRCQVAGQRAGVRGLPVFLARRVEHVGEQAADVPPTPVHRRGSRPRAATASTVSPS